MSPRLSKPARAASGWLACLVGAWLICQPLAATESVLRVVDAAGRPVANALVYAGVAAPVDRSASGEATITQRDMEFQPGFIAVRAGTTIQFPNEDRTRHHVYSFSPAKTFELKLYRDELAAPVRFDDAGIVTLGCNVHDWMIGYIYVVDAERFALTDDEGIARVAGAGDAGGWHVWHPYLKPGGDASLPAAGDAGDAGDDVVTLRVALRDNVAVPQRPETTRPQRTTGRRSAR